MSSREKVSLAVIGGSGLYAMKEIKDVREVKVKTPFGDPSDAIVIGTVQGTRCAFLPRHARGHKLIPTEVNHRANLYALKSLGVRRIVGVAACGSLKEEIAPRHFVFPDQVVDRTKLRKNTFFGEGVVAHVPFAQPFCPVLRKKLHESAASLPVIRHWGGTYVCIEGPMFSTKAESEEYRRNGFSVIGMTVLPEAKLAREAEICYASINAITDYDVWKEGEEVTNEKVVAVMKENIENVQKLLMKVLPELEGLSGECPCPTSLKGAIFTSPEAMNKKTVKKLSLLIGKYVRN